MFQVPSSYAAMQHAWHQPQQQQAQQQQGMPGRGQGPVQYPYPPFMPMLLPYGMPPPMPPMMPMPPGPLGGRGAPPPQGNAGEDPAAIPLHYSGCSIPSCFWTLALIPSYCANVVGSCPSHFAYSTIPTNVVLLPQQALLRPVLGLEHSAQVMG